MLGSSEEVREDFLEEVGSDQGIEIMLNWDGRKVLRGGWNSREEVMTRSWSWKVRTFWKKEEHMTCKDLSGEISVMLMRNLERPGGEQSGRDQVAVPVRDGVMPQRGKKRGQEDKRLKRPRGGQQEMVGLVSPHKMTDGFFSSRRGLWSAHTNSSLMLLPRAMHLL